MATVGELVEISNEANNINILDFAKVLIWISIQMPINVCQQYNLGGRGFGVWLMEEGMDRERKLCCCGGSQEGANPCCLMKGGDKAVQVLCQLSKRRY